MHLLPKEMRLSMKVDDVGEDLEPIANIKDLKLKGRRVLGPKKHAQSR
jgi:hypothetical protein